MSLIGKCCVILILSSIFALLPAQGSTYEQTQELSLKIQENKKNLRDADQQQRKLLSTLYGLHEKIKTLNKKRGRFTNRVFNAKANIKKVARKINRLKVKINSQKHSLGKRLRSLYQMQDLGYLRYFLYSVKTGQVDKNLKYLRLVSKRDMSLIRNHQLSLKKLRTQQRKLKVNVKKYIAEKSKFERSEKALHDQQELKASVLRRIGSLKNKALHNIRSLKQKVVEMNFALPESEISSLFETAFYESKGRLSLPVQGKEVGKYGLILDDQYQYKLTRKGVIYRPSPKSAQVNSIFGGEIAYIGYVTGYGQTVIIDHGDNYHSIYSNLNEVRVKLGRSVFMGEKIAERVNKKGRLSGTLYLEIRHFSESLDPAEWIANKLVVKRGDKLNGKI